MHACGIVTGTRRSQILATLAAWREGRDELAELKRRKDPTTMEQTRIEQLTKLQASRARALRDLPAGDAALGKIVAEGVK